MKPYFIYSAVTVMALLAGGCTQTDGSDPVTSDYLNEVNLSFNLAVNANGKRQTRKLESSDCGQHVTDMRIYVFRSSTGGNDASFTYYRPQVAGSDGAQDYFKVEAFDKDLPIIGDGVEEHPYSIRPRLPKGYYRFLAVGRDDDAAEPDVNNISITWDESTTWSDAIISSTDPYLSGEVFTGYPCGEGNKPLTYYVGDYTNYFKSTINLYRAVAGILLYVENIPDELPSDFSWNATHTVEITDEEGNKEESDELYTIIEKDKEYEISEIAVVAPGYNNKMNLWSRHWLENSFIAETGLFTATRLVSIPVTDIRAEEEEKKDDDGYYNVRRKLGSFVLPSQLAGRQVVLTYVPDDTEAQDITYHFPASMYLAFFTEIDGKKYPVKMLPISDSEQTSHLPGGPSFYTAEELAVKRTQYNLICNNIYCIGDYRTEGPNPPIDNPIDLKEVINKPELNITVIGNWQADVDINL